MYKPFLSHLRYASALREDIATRLARQGTTPQLLAQLRKIKAYECRFRPLEPTATCARDFSDEVLSAAVLVGLTQGRYLPVSFQGIGLYNLDTALYRQCLLALFRAGLRGGKGFQLTFTSNGILLQCDGFWPDENARQLLQRMRGILFKTHGAQKSALIALPDCKVTGLPPSPYPSFQDYLENPLSDVYLYLAP